MNLHHRLTPTGRPRLHRGALMPSRDIGQLRIVKTVKSSQDVEIEARESISFSVVQLVNRTGLAMGHQVHFYRPPRSARHIGAPVLISGDDALVGAFSVQHRSE